MIAPCISIVTISFNQARFLRAAIDSVVGQGYPALDYIIVDPGSTDGSRDIISRYGDTISTVLLAPDDGPADGLNMGFGAARGDIFGYINADDVLLPGALTQIAVHFANPAIDVILGNGFIIDDHDHVLRAAGSSRFSRAAYGHGAMTFLQQGCFFRRETFARAGGFNVANRTCWDSELLIDMAVAGARIHNVSDKLGAFRLYGETITGSGRLAAQMQRDVARIAAKALGRPPLPGDRARAAMHLLARRLMHPRAALAGVAARMRRAR